MLQIGQNAPDFELPGVVGGNIDTHALTEYTDNGWAVVVVFYPFDFHPVCTTQMCTLRDSETLSMVENTVVLGVSTDSVYSHRSFGEEYRIDFPLLSDSDGTVAEAYGIQVDEIDNHREVARSAVFVIDPGRQIQYTWQSEADDDEPDLGAIERATNCHGDTCEIPEEKSYL
ncbi:MAG: redoxin domain-containing protein [Haloarculaceae archaeon]